ncbi:MAG: cyclic nucleotide-binding domain-containing protein [Chloroflexota bacterium]
MLSTIERVLFLRSADIFSAVTGEDLAPLAMVAQEVRFEAGETFIRHGEAGDCLYVVVDGEVGVVVDGVGQVAVRGPGSVQGEMAILADRPRSVDCVAIDGVLALRVDRDDFLELLAERPTLALGVIKVLTQRLYQATEELSRARR